MFLHAARRPTSRPPQCIDCLACIQCMQSIRHRAGACEGTRAFLRCWPCTGPNLRSFYYTYRGAPPPAPKAHDHLFQPKTDLNFGCPPETLKINFGRFLGSHWDPQITKKKKVIKARVYLQFFFL